MQTILSILSHAYKFARDFQNKAVKVWPGVAEEFWRMRCLLPLCCGYLKMPVSSTVAISASSMTGFAVCTGDVLSLIHI